MYIAINVVHSVILNIIILAAWLPGFGNEVDLLVSVGGLPTLGGFPPWMLRVAEIQYG